MRILSLLLFYILLLSPASSYGGTEKRGQTYVYFQDDVIANTITINTLYDYTRCFASVDFFNGAVRTAPTAGTVTITVKTRNTNEFIAIQDNVIDATSITVPNWSGNTVQVRSTPSGITGVTNYQLTVSCNRY